MAKELEDTPVDVVLDARRLIRAEPFGTTMLAARIAGREALGRATVVQPPDDPETAAFLAEIGFPTGVPAAGYPAHAGVPTLRMRRMTELEPLFVQEIASLVQRLVPGTPEEAAGLIELCLNELLQNAFEHSSSPVGCVVHARWFRQPENVKVAVADTGVGIAASLRQNPKYTPLSEVDLVRMAVMDRGVTARRSGRFGGHGLKHLWELAVARSGQLTVLSGGVCMVIRAEKHRVWECRPFAGTVVEVDFRPGAATATSSDDEFF